MITLRSLMEIGACSPALVAFDLAFPTGADSWDQVLDHPECTFVWKKWLLVWILPEQYPVEERIDRMLKLTPRVEDQHFRLKLLSLYTYARFPMERDRVRQEMENLLSFS